MEEKEGKKKDKQQEKKKFSLTQSFLAANLTVKLITAAAVVAVLIYWRWDWKILFCGEQNHKTGV